MEARIRSAFPGIEDFAITSPQTRRYNCIAWAAGDASSWWWPDAEGKSYWPSGAPRNVTLAAFVQAFRVLGYEECYNSALEVGIQKVAIYVDHQGAPAHAARQLENGWWTSKLGPSVDVEHATLEELHGEYCGEVNTIMGRSIVYS